MRGGEPVDDVEDAINAGDLSAHEEAAGGCWDGATFMVGVAVMR